MKIIKYLYLKKDFNRNGDVVKLKICIDIFVCYYYVYVIVDYVFLWICVFNNFFVVFSNISCN